MKNIKQYQDFKILESFGLTRKYHEFEDSFNWQTAGEDFFN